MRGIRSRRCCSSMNTGFQPDAIAVECQLWDLISAVPILTRSSMIPMMDAEFRVCLSRYCKSEVTNIRGRRLDSVNKQTERCREAFITINLSSSKRPCHLSNLTLHLIPSVQQCLSLHKRLSRALESCFLYWITREKPPYHVSHHPRSFWTWL